MTSAWDEAGATAHAMAGATAHAMAGATTRVVAGVAGPTPHAAANAAGEPPAGNDVRDAGTAESAETAETAAGGAAPGAGSAAATATTGKSAAARVAEALAEALVEVPLARRVVAVSGGRDSMVLLHVLAGVHRAVGGPPPRVIHVHHGLTPMADAWAAAVRRACRALGCDCIVRRVRVERAGRGLEAAAREARMEAFSALLGAGDHLLTAHHRDDQAETVLLRLLRGAGPRGLAGMRGTRPLGSGALTRPLLATEQALLAAAATELGLQWHEDPSNDDRALDRNYLRHEILPRLAARWPAAVRSIERAARACGEQQSLLDARLDAHLDGHPDERPDARPDARLCERLCERLEDPRQGLLDGLLGGLLDDGLGDGLEDGMDDRPDEALDPEQGAAYAAERAFPGTAAASPVAGIPVAGIPVAGTPVAGVPVPGGSMLPCALLDGDPRHARALLRRWLSNLAVAMPPRARLDELLRQLRAGADARMRIDLGTVTLHRFRGALHAVPGDRPSPCGAERIAAPGSVDLGCGQLLLRPVVGAGLRSDRGVPEARFRRGGERLRPAGRGGSVALKQWLQEAGVPPWERGRLPLLYLRGELAAVAGLHVCEGWRAAAGEPGWLPCWTPA